MERAEVAQLYVGGVEAVVSIADGLSARQWSEPACGSWSAADTMRHLVSVTGWYHDWLDRAMSGDVTRPFPGEQIDAYTAAALEDLRQLPADDAVVEYRRAATDYLERVADHLDLPYAFPFGTVTAGLHLGVAAAEWHLHAWDLSTTTDDRHRPDDPAALMLAVGECVSAASGAVKGAIVRRVVPLAARRSPWETLLRRSGRS